MLPLPAIDLTYVACGKGLKAADFPKQVRGRIALIQRGEITFAEKALNAEKAGAHAVVIYNNGPGGFFGTLGDGQLPKVPVVSISREDGEAMIKHIRDQNPISRAKLRLSPEEVPQADRLAEFSSRGPNNDFWIKPEITAPGVNIYSATILAGPYAGGGMPDPSGYTVASGTSMATPHVAGAVALIRQAHPTWTPVQIKAALVNTARLMPGQGAVMDQGSGALDLERALDCPAILVTADDPFEATVSFGKVINDGGVKRVSRALTIRRLTGEAEASPFELSVDYAPRLEGLEVKLSVGSITCTDVCYPTFELTMTADGARLPDGEYCGWVVAKSAWGTLRLPLYYQAARQPWVDPVDPTNQGVREGEGRKRLSLLAQK